MSDIIEIGGSRDNEESGMKKRMPLRKRTECQRCGDCCQANTPTVLKQDFGLFIAGVLTPANTYTVRIGEPMKSPGDSETYHSTLELVRVKPREDSTDCPFHDETAGCAIYERRPKQCVSYACWQLQADITGLEHQALTRQDIFGSVAPIMEIIRTHDERCSYERLVAAFEKTSGGDAEAVDEILDMLHYDTYLRPQLAERLSLPEEAFDLILGRPLHETVKGLGLTVARDGDTFVLQSLDRKEDQ